VFIDPDEDKRLGWVADRIVDIKKYHDAGFPTVALFVRDDAAVQKTAKWLNEQELLSDNNMSAQACRGGEVLGEANSIRVFSLEYIKGLEFEAVFFLDVDTVSMADEQMIDKYIYVGISRANQFLAITAEQELPACLVETRDLFVMDSNWRIG
jgi:hypothetical protein